VRLTLVLAAVDAATAVYLLAWALRRERRDKPAVLVVGVVLAVCAMFLVAATVRATEPDQPPQSPATVPAGTPV
jgi:hypothetical protein